jgi:hypothetical protein
MVLSLPSERLRASGLPAGQPLRRGSIPAGAADEIGIKEKHIVADSGLSMNAFRIDSNWVQSLWRALRPLRLLGLTGQSEDNAPNGMKNEWHRAFGVPLVVVSGGVNTSLVH